MARSIQLTDNDRTLLNDIVSSLRLTQATLAEDAQVSRPWLSQILSGRRRAVDIDKLEQLADHLHREVGTNRRVDEARRQQAQTFLNGFRRATSDSAPLLHPPLALIPADAAQYIKRLGHDTVLGALAKYTFKAVVEGPPQSGKSTLLSVLEHRAREIGYETAWFNVSDFVEPVQSTTTTEHQQILFISGLYEVLRTEWGLAEDAEGPPRNLMDLNHWLIGALRANKARPRLLIFDDLVALGARLADDWLRLFLRSITNKANQERLRFSIGVGLTHFLGTYFRLRLDPGQAPSSILAPDPRVTTDWFSPEEAAALSQKLGSDKADTAEIYDLFKGQPYLTHAAFSDPSFRAAACKGEAVRTTDPYRRHLRAVRRCLVGPFPQPDAYHIGVLRTFLSFRDRGRGDSRDFEHVSILRESRLLDENGRLKLPIYRYFADDLANLLPPSGTP